MLIHCAHTKVVDVNSLTPHPRNPNKHSDKQIKMLAKIIEYNGWRHPITVSKQTGYVNAGHARIMAAKLMGWKTVPIDEQDFENEAMEYANMVADNKIQELSESDDELIQELALDVGPEFDYELFGIDDFKLKGIDTLAPAIDPGEVDSTDITSMRIILCYDEHQYARIMGCSNRLMEYWHLKNLSRLYEKLVIENDPDKPKKS